MLVQFNQPQSPATHVSGFYHLTLGVLIACVVLLCTSGCERNYDTSQTAKKDTLVFAFQPQENPEGLELNTRAFAEYMSAKTGYKVEVFLPTNYASVVEALRNSHADVAYFSAWPYMIAHKRAGAELLVVEERDGAAHYYSNWFVLEDSPIQTLNDLQGRSVAFTSPSSTSGYLFPFSHLVDEKVVALGQDPQRFFGEVLFAGGYQQALLALVHGQVQAAAASDYALKRYLTDEQQARVRVLSTQGPVPTHGIAIRSALPETLKQSVRDALLELNAPENAGLLKSIYGAEKLVVRSHDEHTKSLTHAAKQAGLEYPL